ncbi:MAG: hypothetical protein GY953_00365, partial [bacterium]|nr:hypothetical protein [bacterium]
MLEIRRSIVAVVTLLLATIWTAPGAELTTKKALNLEVAKEIAAAAEAFG